MNRPTIHISLDDNRRVFRPGETLSGQCVIGSTGQQEVKAVEISVLWYTEGKGDEDLAVHYFDRQEPNGVKFLDLYRPLRFSTCLPRSPLSYSGVILKLRWCVRVRVFLGRGKDVVEELPFQLGAIAQPQPVLT